MEKKEVCVKKGFTLIELIVVIAIIAILAAIIAPNAFKAIEKAKISRTLGDYRSIKTAVLAYHIDTNVWPISSADGSDLLANTSAEDDWEGPYLESWPQGAFGTITLCNASGTAPCIGNFGSIGNEIYLALEGLSTDQRNTTDEKIDDGNNTTGIVRWNSTNLTALISVK